MANSAQDCIASLLESHAASRVLLIGDSIVLPECELEVTCLSVTDAPEGLPALGRFDFAVVADLLETLQANEAGAVLGRLKNLHAKAFLLLVDESRSRLGREELLALALAPFAALEDGRVAWLYDFDQYNPEREWNNPEAWAHPENFRKFRW